MQSDIICLYKVASPLGHDVNRGLDVCRWNERLHTKRYGLATRSMLHEIRKTYENRGIDHTYAMNA